MAEDRRCETARPQRNAVWNGGARNENQTVQKFRLRACQPQRDHAAHRVADEGFDGRVATCAYEQRCGAGGFLDTRLGRECTGAPVPGQGPHTVAELDRADALLPVELTPADWPGPELRGTYDAFDAAFKATLSAWLRSQPA